MDTNKTLRKIKDDHNVIPSRIAKGLKNGIGLKEEFDNQSTKAVIATESLMWLFVELVGHYKRFIIPNSENKYNHFQVIETSLLMRCIV